MYSMESRIKEKVTVVIPSIKDDVVTLDSVPEGVPTSVEREGSLNEARNRGVRNSDSEIVAVMDDDIRFTERVFWDVIDRAEERVVGLEGWLYGLFAGRVMVFPKEIWEDVGGFDERLGSHMGDTDFAIRVTKHGHDFELVPREVFDHEDHKRSITAFDHAWRGVYLSMKHPRWTPRLFNGMIGGAI